MTEVSVAKPQARTIGKLVGALSGLNEVRCIVLSGSIARGYWDKYCDVDLGVLCDALPGRESRLAALAGIRDEEATPFLSTEVAEGFYDTRGHWVDVHYTLVSEWQNAVEECSGAQGPVEPWTMETFQNVHYAVPVYDPQAIAHELRKGAQVYPSSLRTFDAVEYFGEMCQSLKQLDDNESLLGELAYLLSTPGIIFPLFRCLGALNDCLYFAGWQMEFYVDKFLIAPPRCTERLRSVYGATLDRVGRQQRREQLESLICDLKHIMTEASRTDPVLQDACQGLDELYPFRRALRENGAHESAQTLVVANPSAEGLAWEFRMLEACLNKPPAELAKYAHRHAVVWYRELLRGKILSLLKMLMRLNQVQEVAFGELDQTIRALGVFTSLQ